jgi:hypothetical protein
MAHFFLSFYLPKWFYLSLFPANLQRKSIKLPRVSDETDVKPVEIKNYQVLSKSFKIWECITSKLIDKFKLSKTNQRNNTTYRSFHGFGQAKLVYGSLVLGLSQFSLWNFVCEHIVNK